MNNLEHGCPFIARAGLPRQNRYRPQVTRRLAGRQTQDAVGEHADLYSGAVRVKCSSRAERFVGCVSLGGGNADFKRGVRSNWSGQRLLDCAAHSLGAFAETFKVTGWVRRTGTAFRALVIGNALFGLDEAHLREAGDRLQLIE